MKAHIDPIIGRYMHVQLQGQACRVYFEEAGQGIPLICLHTAGADGRQYRHLLRDPEITANFQVIVFDMPWHGKSSPPEGWQDTDYQLTTAAYMEMVLAVADALALEKPLVMGCSIGGRAVLHLARLHGARLAGVIGLQSSGMVEPYYDTQWLHRSDVHGGEVCAAQVSGLIAPTAPLGERWETLWHYMQGGPGVFRGDLHFYKFEGDIRLQLADIDTKVCPVFMLTGEYDYSCTPAESQATADAIAGAELTVMAGLGHFPMSEDYDRFRDYLMPVLGRFTPPQTVSS
jgi:pimeloyl-ACP methyl ester carboxylesterase